MFFLPPQTLLLPDGACVGAGDGGGGRGYVYKFQDHNDEKMQRKKEKNSGMGLIKEEERKSRVITPLLYVTLEAHHLGKLRATLLLGRVHGPTGGAVV